ncbi:nitroreductase family protein [Micromonospora sp. ATA32]|nr:nitroreductase family protein [Micromonospora sp. ATA32]
MARTSSRTHWSALRGQRGEGAQRVARHHLHDAQGHPDTHLQEIFEKERADGRFADPEIQKGWEAGASNFVEIQTENYGGDVLHWLEKNTYLVVGATMMAAASLGVDATPMEGFDRTTVDAAFDLTDTDYTTTLLLVLGYPDEARVSRQPVSRFDAEKIFTHM